MQNQYELMIIFTPVLPEEDLKKGIKKYEKFIKTEGGEIVNNESWGLRQMAYPIAKKTTGIYQLYEFKAPGEIIGKLEIQFGRDDSIMRFMFTKLDRYAIEYNIGRRERLSKKPEEKEQIKEDA
jgi:small subunit ribosomal protein S6